MTDSSVSALQSAVEDRKEKLVDKLSTSFSLNKISLEEYERLIKYSQNIETDKELQILENLIEGHSASEAKTESSRVFETHSDHSAYRSSGINASPQNNVTILSSRTMKGALTSGNYLTVLGDNKIIIDEDDLVNGNTELNFMVLLGSVVIHVSENIDVISRVIPVLGDVFIDKKVKNNSTRSEASSGRKRLTLNGNAFLGDIKVKVKK